MSTGCALPQAATPHRHGSGAVMLILSSVTASGGTTASLIS